MPPPPSYCALVGSYDSSCTAYSAAATSQPATVELIAAFSFMIKALLTRYKTRNGNLPESVIYWRDGLSDSQISAFLDTEVKDLRSAFEAEGVSVKLTIINCVKNHHMRMWPKSENGDRLGNVMPGTVIETAKNSKLKFAKRFLEIFLTLFRLDLRESLLPTGHSSSDSLHCLGG